jgi:serine phosphatase RsbU (regulator of sigma subunit)
MYPGDSFICVSDGIVEAANPAHQIFGFARLERLLRAAPSGDPEALVTTLLDQVWRFAGGHPDDDVSALVAQVQ